MEYTYIGCVMPDEGEGRFMRLVSINDHDTYEDPIANWEEVLELTTGYRYYRQKFSGALAIPFDLAQKAARLLEQGG